MLSTATHCKSFVAPSNTQTATQTQTIFLYSLAIFRGKTFCYTATKGGHVQQVKGHIMYYMYNYNKAHVFYYTVYYYII